MGSRLFRMFLLKDDALAITRTYSGSDVKAKTHLVHRHIDYNLMLVLLLLVLSTTNVWMRRNPQNEHVEISEPEQFNTARINKNDFFNIVAIVGSARTGKSTLMNRLVESDVFKTSKSRHACTEGVCLSELKKVGENGVVVYADTEGKGNNNINNDNKLLMPVALLSKVVIFNVWKQVLVERQLDELEIFVHIGDRIKLDDHPLKFGHLIIAVRDYDFEDGKTRE